MHTNLTPAPPLRRRPRLGHCTPTTAAHTHLTSDTIANRSQLQCGSSRDVGIVRVGRDTPAISEDGSPCLNRLTDPSAQHVPTFQTPSKSRTPSPATHTPDLAERGTPSIDNASIPPHLCNNSTAAEKPNDAPENHTLDDPVSPREGLFANIVNDCQATFIESIGTTTFLTLAYGGVQASAYEAGSQGLLGLSVERVMYISLSIGLSLLTSAWLFFSVTGGLFNPNVPRLTYSVGDEVQSWWPKHGYGQS